MKQQTIILWIFLGAMFAILFTNIQNKYSYLIFLLALFILYKIKNFTSFLNNKINGELMLIRQKKVLNPASFLLIILLVLTTFNEKNNLLIIIFICMNPVFEIITAIIIKNKKTVGLVLKDNEIINNDDWSLEKGNIHHLTKIDLIGYGLWNQIQFSFNNRGSIIINKGEFNEPELTKLFTMIKNQSKNEVEISKELLKLD